MATRDDGRLALMHPLDKLARAQGHAFDRLPSEVAVEMFGAPKGPRSWRAALKVAGDALAAIQQSTLADLVPLINESAPTIEWLATLVDDLEKGKTFDADIRLFLVDAASTSSRTRNPAVGALGSHPFFSILNSLSLRSSTADTHRVVSWLRAVAVPPAMALHVCSRTDVARSFESLALNKESEAKVVLQSLRARLDGVAQCYDSQSLPRSQLLHLVDSIDPPELTLHGLAAVSMKFQRIKVHLAAGSAARDLAHSIHATIDALRDGWGVLQLSSLKRTYTGGSIQSLDLERDEFCAAPRRLQFVPASNAADYVPCSADVPADAPTPQVTEQKIESSDVEDGLRRAVLPLPLSWTTYNIHERRIVTRQLQEALQRNGTGESANNARVELTDFLLGQSQDAPNQTRRRVAAVMPADCFKPTDDEDLYRSTSQQLNIQLSQKTESTIDDEAQQDRPQSKAPTNYKTDKRIRRSKARDRNAMSSALWVASRDVVLVQHLLPGSAVNSTGSYYVRYSASELTEIGKAVSLDFGASDDAIGSYGVPVGERLRQAFQEIDEQLSAAGQGRTLEEVFLHHNIYTARFTLVNKLGTGHREVRDPFHAPSCFLPDEGLLLAPDKAVLEGAASRLAVFPSGLHPHHKRYRQHLANLAKCLKPLQPTLSLAVENLLETHSQSTLPYLFFIRGGRVEQVSETSIREVLVGSWPFHASALRHFLATQLRPDAPAGLIHAHMGHAFEGVVAFGSLSALSAREMADRLNQPLSGLLKTLGIVPKSGCTGREISLGVAGDDPVTWKEDRLLGPYARIERRESTLRKVIVQCREVFEPLEIAAMSRTLTDECVDLVRKNLALTLQGSTELHIGLRLLNKRLRRMRKRGVRAPLTGLPPPPRPVGSPPTHSLDGLEIHLAEAVRNRFRAWAEESLPCWIEGDQKREGALDWAAAITVSAIVFGGLFSKRRKNFSRALIAGNRYRVDGIEWLEIDDKGVRDRFICDLFTRLLIRHTFSNDDRIAELKSLTHNSISRRAERIIRDWRPGPNPSNLGLVELTQACEQTLALKMPGCIAGYLRGDVSTTVLPPAALTRLLSGRKFQLPDRADVEWSTTVQAECPDAPSHGDDLVAQQALIRQFWDDFSKFRDAGTTASAVDAAQHITNAKKTLLATGCWPIVWYLVLYAEHLVEQGGVRKRNLARSTVLTYLHRNCDAIVRVYGGVDPIALDDDERNELVSKLVVAHSSDDHPSESLPPFTQKLKRLRYFDDWLVSQGAVPVDWSSHVSGVKGSQVRANIVSEEDFARCIAQLNGLPSTDAGNAAKFTAQAMFRFGMRNGEAERLTPADLFLDSPAIAYVRRKRGQGPKTRAGTRQIPTPDAGDLVDFRKLLKSLIEAKHGEFVAGQDVPIVGDSGIAAVRATRSEWTAELTKALRAASGDPTLTPYALRHTFANRMIVLALGVEHPWMAKLLRMGDYKKYLKASREFRRTLTGDDFRSEHLLPAIAMLMGHVSINTTFHHYVHLFDVISAAELDLHCPQINQNLLAKLAGLSHSSLRVRKHRNTAVSKFRYEYLLALDSKVLSPIHDLLPAPVDGFLAEPDPGADEFIDITTMGLRDFSRLALQLMAPDVSVELTSCHRIPLQQQAALRSACLQARDDERFRPITDRLTYATQYARLDRLCRPGMPFETFFRRFPLHDAVLLLRYARTILTAGAEPLKAPTQEAAVHIKRVLLVLAETDAKWTDSSSVQSTVDVLLNAATSSRSVPINLEELGIKASLQQMKLFLWICLVRLYMLEVLSDCQRRI